MVKKQRRISEICARIREVADLMEREKREMTEEEAKEIKSLKREKTMLELQITGAQDPANAPMTREAKWANLTKNFRELAKSRRQMEYQLREEGATTGDTATTAETSMFTNDMAKGNLVPLTVGDILYPIEEELIWNKIGVRIPTGLSGEYSWPVVGSDVEAEFAGEGVEINEVKVELDKVSATQQRVAIAMSETRESVFNSKGKVEEIIRTMIPRAVARAINKVVLSPAKIANQQLAGPLVKAPAYKCTYDFKGLNGAKAQLLAKGYSEEGMVWVMSYAKKAELEATPMDTGSGIMVIRDNKLCGLPVYCTAIVGDDIYLGDWRYQVVGQFGTPSFVVDPVTKATSGKIRFILNTNYGTATLRQDAFLKCEAKA